MLLYWFLGLLLPVPLAGTAMLLRRMLRPYVSIRTLALWSGLCVANGLFLWKKYYADNITEYAAGYRETAFLQVTVGMSQAQVRALLGEPLAQWQPYHDGAKRHYVSYDFSRPEGGDGDYEIRQIHFDRDKVAEVICYRWYD